LATFFCQSSNWTLILTLLTGFVPTWSVSQVLPVYREPHHQLVFSNPQARILDVNAEPGDTTQFHLHADDICYVAITGSTIWLEDDSGVQRTVDLPNDFVGSDTSHSESPSIHRFANVGDSRFRLIAVENLMGPIEFGSVQQRLGGNNIMLLNNTRFSVIEIQIPAGTVEILTLINPSVIILITGSLNIANLKTGQMDSLENNGDWIWLDGNSEIRVMPHDHSPALVRYIEVKGEF